MRIIGSLFYTLLIMVLVVPFLYGAYIGKNVNPFNFKSIKSVLAFLNIIFVCILILSMSFVLKTRGTDDGPFMLAGLILFAFLQFFLITNNTLVEFLSNKTKIMQLYLFNNFYFETNKCIVKLKIEKGWKNIYCWKNNKIKTKVCIVREIENMEDIFLFLSLFYENFSKSNYLDYQDFTDFAKKNGMFIKTYEVDIKKEEKILPIEYLLRKRGISTEVKKLNINNSSEEELSNLPFINIIKAKKIKKQINEVGQFKSFWEFANFAEITPNQGLILSKLVNTKKLQFKKDNTVINKDKSDRKVDI